MCRGAQAALITFTCIRGRGSYGAKHPDITCIRLPNVPQSTPRQPQAERLAALAYNNTACAVHVLLDAAEQRELNQTRLSPAAEAVLRPAGVRIVFYDSARAEYRDAGKWDARTAWQGMTGPSSLALTRFAARGDYNHSWLIEDDVFFTGHWGSVVQWMNREAGGADLVAKTERFSEDEIGTRRDWYARRQCGVRGGAGRNGSRWRDSCDDGGGAGGGCHDAENTVACDTWDDSQYGFSGQWEAGSAEACEARCRLHRQQQGRWDDCFAFRFSADTLEHVTQQQRRRRSAKLSPPGNAPPENYSSYTHNLCVVYWYDWEEPLLARRDRLTADPLPPLTPILPLTTTDHSNAAPTVAAPASSSITARIAAKQAQLDAADKGPRNNELQIRRNSELRASLFAEVQVLRAEAAVLGVSVADDDATDPDRVKYGIRNGSLGLELPLDRDAPRSCRVSKERDSWRKCTSIAPRPAWISEQCGWSMMRVSRRLAAKMTELLDSEEVFAHHELYPGMACERLGDCARVDLSKITSGTGENIIDATFSAGGWGAFSVNHSSTAYRLDQGWQGPHVVVPGRIYHPVRGLRPKKLT